MKPTIKQSDVTRNYPSDWLETHHIRKIMSQCVFDPYSDGEEPWIDEESYFEADIIGVFVIYEDGYVPNESDKNAFAELRKKYHRNMQVDGEEWQSADIHEAIYGTTDGLANDKEWFAVYIPQAELDVADDDGELFEDMTIAHRRLNGMTT